MSSEPLSLGDFKAQVLAPFVSGRGVVRDDERVVEALALDEVSAIDLLSAVQELNPYFDLPDQVDVSDVTVADLYHYYCVMSQGHLA